ncbi:MAG: RNA polymerase sigma factor [Candidatus Pacebacteria bacterium]|nr:RNA polymerase sigma factor [Candidatus Paceibacterota bacterium]
MNCEKMTDEELVELVFENKAYFSCIVFRYEKKLKRYIRRITNLSEEDIDDVLQEIFIKVYTNLHGFDTDLTFSSWIYRIAYNTAISIHRKREARPEGHMIDAPDEVLINIVGETDVEKEVDVQYLRKHLLEAMESISQKYKDVLVLRFFEEKEYQEISDILQKPPGSVATLINRAKKQLKKEFIRQGYSQYDYER